MLKPISRALVLVCLLTCPCLADIKTYIDKPDDSYAYKVVQEQQVMGVNIRVVDFTSQTWEDKPWQHWLFLITPKVIQHPGKAILIIAGGSNRPGIPKLPKEVGLLASTCEQLGVPVAILAQVPNQPLYDNLREDNLIAHSMTMYFASGNEEQILLLPMVKSAVKAMDCISELMTESHGKPVDEFVVSGASKRGWTTYLTAAVDQRVIAAAPMVIDMLKLPEQMEKQKQVYGEQLSPKITPYTSRGVL
ncbi:MAG TPA: PhoPQ-activated pathogenicity-like protein PqaA type, partial [Phycisphaerales bacterium]|nr:PhoPQ-activated pathogenicity-like protein PqaA type [Phycisphaerales bacterium]